MIFFLIYVAVLANLLEPELICQPLHTLFYSVVFDSNKLEPTERISSCKPDGFRTAYVL